MNPLSPQLQHDDDAADLGLPGVNAVMQEDVASKAIFRIMQGPICRVNV